MKEIKNCDCKAQEIKDLQFQLDLAKQELNKNDVSYFDRIGK